MQLLLPRRRAARSPAVSVLSIFVTQLLPLLLALLGAILGAALGIYFGTQAHARIWYASISALLGLVVAGTAYLIFDGIALERRVRILSEVVRHEIDQASDIEYRARQTGGAGTFQLAPFVAEIETWRTRVDEWLRRELPESGADVRFRTGTGQVGVGPELYEYTRLNILRSNLLSVLDNLPSYVQRSR